MLTAEHYLAVLENPTTPLEERIQAGHALAQLGDPRAKTSHRIDIPQGLFVFRGGPGAETSACPIFLSAYAIERYPVTVAAYAEFITAGGYQKRRYWTERGWTWRTREHIQTPRFWGENEWAAYLIPNHPIVGVSAYEAEAYAAFRDARLPTSAEWEKACRGPNGHCYPWGNTFCENFAGSRNTGPRSTVPIGTFPQGKSPYGLYDMLGCVWQWCADAADADAENNNNSKNPFNDPEDYDESTPRVTRGGAWNTLPWNVICTSQNAYAPTARFSNLGFRLAYSPGD